MATSPVRRIQSSQAAKRGAAAAPARPAPAPAPRRSTEERGRGFLAVSAKDRDGTYHEAEKELDILQRQFSEAEPPAYVKVGAGMTINLGNFESLRIDCSVTLPCLPTEIEETYAIASNFVADRIAEEQTAWTGETNSKSKR